MNPKAKIAGCLSFAFAMALLAPEAWADTHPTARPGTLNYVEGQACIGTEILDAGSMGKAEVGQGHSLQTREGKAEILLTPGVFLRLGDSSSARMISSGLLDTAVAIERGEATVEVDEIHKENNLRIVEDGKTTDLVKTGVYDFNADRQLVRVLDGKAFVEDGDRRI